MYNVIHNRSSVPDLYVKQLEVCAHGDEAWSNHIMCVQPQSAVDVQITAEEISKVTASYTDELNHCLKQAGDHTPPVSQFRLHLASILFC